MRKTKKITISAVLTALSFVYIIFMPGINIPLWSFTPFSHIFLFIACLISPYTAFMTYLAVVGGFILRPGATYFVWLRAASHLFFIIFLVIYIKIFKLKSKKHILIASACTAVIHAGFEVLAVLLGLAVGFEGNGTLYYILVVVGLGTLGHSLLDYFAAIFVFKVSRLEKFIEPNQIEPLKPLPPENPE